MGSPKRRARLVTILQSALSLPVIPSEEEFLATIRVVPEVMESNGSSMASTCGSTLSLWMPAFSSVLVSGAVMGLIQENGKTVVLTDTTGS